MQPGLPQRPAYLSGRFRLITLLARRWCSQSANTAMPMIAATMTSLASAHHGCVLLADHPLGRLSWRRG